MTLSGLDVVKAGGRAGYTYLTEGRVADTFVLKAPITVGTVKSSLSYVQGAGQTRLLAVCAIAALLPVLLCFLSVGMLFLAEGKKTMILPTLFTSLVLAELLVVLAVFPALHPFLLAGGIFLYTAARSRMDTHSDRMDYRRVPATGEAGKRAEKTGKESEAVRTPLAAQKIPPAEKVKKETQPERRFFHKKEEYSRKQNTRVESLSDFL